MEAYPDNRHQACSGRIQGIISAQSPVRVQALRELLCYDVPDRPALGSQQQLQSPCACRRSS